MIDRVINLTGLDDSIVERATTEISSTIAGWRKQKSPVSMFSRGEFSQPSDRQQTLAAVATAATDSVVSSALDEIESLTIDGITFESPDQATADLLNQNAAEVDLDSVMRRMLREVSIYGLFTAANWWENKARTVVGKTVTSKDRKKTVTAIMPKIVSILDVNKVVPLSTGPWGTRRLLWQHEDMDEIDLTEPAMERLLSGKFVPSASQADKLREAGATNTDALWELNAANVWQHMLTCPDYLLYPEAPLKMVLPLLELRARLLDADRASLIGAANYILVVKLGTDEHPAQVAERDQAIEGMKNIAKLPVIVGDHRMVVDIIAPPTDSVLNTDKHSVIDMAIWCSLMGMPPRAAVAGTGAMDAEILANLMTSRLESRRKMVARGVERFIVTEVLERNPGAKLAPAKLTFRPRDIELYGLQTRLGAVLAARSRRDLSRESYLGVLSFDQEVEAQRMKHEAEFYDETFQTVEPFSSPENQSGGSGAGGAAGNKGGVSADQGGSGSAGGRPSGKMDSSKRDRKAS